MIEKRRDLRLGIGKSGSVQQKNLEILTFWVHRRSQILPVNSSVWYMLKDDVEDFALQNDNMFSLTPPFFPTPRVDTHFPFWSLLYTNNTG